jgi:hypothetical protein
MNRSGSLDCPVCTRPERLVEHHIRGRDIPNPNHESNLVNLCSNCHDKCHEGTVVIEGWYQTSGGYELFWHSPEENSFTGNDAETHVR